MLDTHTIANHLLNLDNIYNFRMKIYDVALLISNEKISASRLSGGLSAYLRLALHADLDCTIETEIRIGDRESIIKMRLPYLKSACIQTKDFFDNMLPETDNKTVSISKAFINGNKKIDFDEVLTVLNQKTNEELIREVEAKNMALQTSLENLARTSKEKNRMEDELNVAQSIQLSMLPLDFEIYAHRPDIDIFAHLTPAREVGGDFYDFFFLDDINFAIVVGDVSGKGVPAALMMAVCKTLLKSRASTDKSTASILTHVNNEMAKDNKNFMFVTVFMAILNTSTGDFTYTNAGHNPTYIKRSNGEIEKLGRLHGPVVAAMEAMSYKESKIQLQKGDIVLGYTDGITEAHNPQGELFGDDRLYNFLKQQKFESAKLMIENLVEEVKQFEGGAEPFDDITALCLEYCNELSNMEVQQKVITISNNIEDVQVALEAFEEFAEFCEISMPVTMKVNVVLDELLSNIVKYGFDDDKPHSIRVSLEFYGRKLMITFEDDGIPFNPFQKTPPDLTLPIEQREIGGLGIHLVRKLMDEFSYKRDVNRNIVSMVKYEV
jgi:sigma-B regulation protein RsbU (phosphoserine phosphatase)